MGSFGSHGGASTPADRRAPRMVLLTWSALVLLVVGSAVTQAFTVRPAQAFGTINGLGQRAEHEHITRAALACAPGVKSTGDCFEPRSIDQLAGHSGTFGAVGSPDLDEFSDPNAHCDDADFLNVAGYPQSRAVATANLLGCVNHLRGRFQQGVTAAAGLLDSDGELIGSQVDLKSDCTFAGGVAGRAKCNAIEGLGRALHGAQDFYSHSNWADQSDPARPIGIANPPGLNLPGPSPILDLAGTSTPAIPIDLTTGFFSGAFSDRCPGATRITHACLNKDKALIDPVSGATSDPRTPRGQVLSNEQKAVAGAIAETRRQWADFRASLISTYGSERGNRMILAIAQDVPKVDLVFAIDTTGSMAPFIAGAVAAANDVVDQLSGRGTPPRLADFRIGLVDYKDVDSTIPGCPPDYDAVTDLAFSAKRSSIVAAIGTLPGKVGGGCDIPEDVLSGIQRAIGFPWRDGVNKAIIVMGDAPGHDPEAHSGLTSASVIAAANAVDPASVYPILVGFNGSATTFLTNLATGTGGRAFPTSGSSVGAAILAAIETVTSAPPSGDVTPPTVQVSFPAPPDGQGGFFNGSQVPVTGTVTASDPSTVTAMDCADSAGGLVQGPLTGAGTTSASRTLSVSGDGTHLVTCTATDGAAAPNAGAAPDSNPVAGLDIDGTAPVVSCAASPDQLWPPNHKLVAVTTTVTVDDATSGPAGFALRSATSSEPDDGSGDGDTAGDIQDFDTGQADTSGQLRAERSGDGDGRTYTLTYEGADVAGNHATCAATVVVRHDQGH